MTKTKRKSIAVLLALIAIIAIPFSPAYSSRNESAPAMHKIAGYEPAERAASPDDDFTYINVLITTGDSPVLEFDLYGEYYFTPENRMGTAGTAYPIRIEYDNGLITATSIDTGEILAQNTDLILHRSKVNYMAGYAKLTYSGSEKTLGRMYLGDFHFYIENDLLSMVNTVPMTYYIYGVVGYELNIYCQPEALKAQAVAAQAFGMYYMGSTKPWDVKDGYSSSIYQAYRGYRTNRLATMPFCYAVLGETISFNNTFVPIFYGHSNGGETALPSHVWGGASQDPAYCVRLDPADYESNNSIDRINIEFGGTGDNTRLLDFILCMIRDTYSMQGQRVVSINDFYVYDPVPGTTLNNQRLHASAVIERLVLPDNKTIDTKDETPEPIDEPSIGPTESPSPDPTVEPTPEPTPIPTPYPVQEEYEFDCSTSLLRSYVLTDMDGSGDDYSAQKYVFTHNYLIYWGKEKENGYTLIFARYGHGLGLSQIGAETWADPDGHAWGYRDIIDFYYPNFDFINVKMTNPDMIDEPSLLSSHIKAYAVCTADGTEFRKRASDKTELLGIVNEDEHLDIINVTDSGWYNAIWNGIEGYIPISKSSIVLFPSPPDGRFIITSGEVKTAGALRTEPYVRSGNIIASLPVGTKLTVRTHIGKWCVVTDEYGRSGFVSSLMIELYGGMEVIGMESIPLPDQARNYTRTLKPKPLFGRISE